MEVAHCLYLSSAATITFEVNCTKIALALWFPSSN